MRAPTPTRLIVRVDDFGMCHAVNLGIETAFRYGIASQTSIMAACPWFPLRKPWRLLDRPRLRELFALRRSA